VTISLRRILATLPSGLLADPLDNDQLGRYLGEHLNNDENHKRNERHCLRDEMYRDGGCRHMTNMIDAVFKDPEVRRLRAAMVEHARFNNPIKRIVNELSTVYAEPAARTVEGKTQNDRYQLLLDSVRMDEQMLQISRLLNLHRTLLVGFRVRQNADGEREPVIDIATPAIVRAVLHPNDSKQVVAWVIRTDFRPAQIDSNTPAWMVWTDHEVFQLRGNWTVIGESYKEHGLGVNPWTPVTLSPPASGFWPGEEGEDLVAAHKAIWLINILAIKETKSANRQVALSGDITTMARDQAADTERPLELPDGVSVQTIDSSMDISVYRDMADYVLTATGNNYGMPGALLTHQGTQSAEARELLRVPLRELRKQQQIPLRIFERKFARVMSAVLKVDAPALNFDASGWRIDFGESQTPLSAMDSLRLFLAERAAGVTDTIEYIKSKNPDLDDEQAEALMKMHYLRELARNVLMRPLMAINGGMGAEMQPPAFMPKEETQLVDASAPDGGLAPQVGAPTPQQNGAKGGLAAMKGRQ
jgi:hypothetical protein